MDVAPASRAALTTSAINAGLSDSPGRMGAIPTVVRQLEIGVPQQPQDTKAPEGTAGP
jgi:hypothetical protein